MNAILASASATSGLVNIPAGKYSHQSPRTKSLQCTNILNLQKKNWACQQRLGIKSNETCPCQFFFPSCFSPGAICTRPVKGLSRVRSRWVLIHTGLDGWCPWSRLMHTVDHEWHREPSTGRTADLKPHKIPRISPLPNEQFTVLENTHVHCYFTRNTTRWPKKWEYQLNDLGLYLFMLLMISDIIVITDHGGQAKHLD